MKPVSQTNTLIYEFGPYRLDAAERVLTRGGEMVPLPPKVFDTLLALVENNGRILEKEELLQRVWPDSFVEENSLNKNVSALRKMLGAGQDDQKYIETVTKRGYRFVAPVRQVTPEASQPVRAIAEQAQPEGEAEPATGEVASPPPQAKPSARRTGILIAAATVLLAVGLAAVIFSLWRADKPAPPGPPPKSVAVLPFKDLAGKGGDKSLELGMADAIITRLSGIRQLVVRPTAAVAGYADADKDALTAGRELRVESVVEGRIQRQDDRLKFTVQLMNVRDGAVVWASPFDVKDADLFMAQDSISEQVAQALALRLTGEEKGRLRKRYTEDLEAYHAYTRGRYFWNKRTPENFRKATEFFKQAIELDPAYPLAWSGLSDCYFFEAAQAPPGQAMPKAKEAARRALELDDSLAEAHASLARAQFYYDWDWTAAEQSFRRAIELNPNYASAHQWYAQYLMDAGRQDEAMREIRRAQQLDPLSLIIHNDVGTLLYDARRYDEAIAVFKEVLEMEPGFARSRVDLGRTLEQKGMYDEAIAQYQKAISLAGDLPSTAALLGSAYAAAGKRAQAEAALTELKRRAEQSYVSPYFIAVMCAGLGDKEQALAWLEKAYEERFGYMVYLGLEPRFDGLRSDARFQDLLRRVRGQN